MKTPDRRALRRIELKNLLSFGPDSPALELENLNILIGANGSGKSNLIQALSLLRATPMSPASKMDMRTIISRGGGVDEWIWKGGSKPNASIDVVVTYPGHPMHLRHLISFREAEQRLKLQLESIEDCPDRLPSETYYFVNDRQAEIQANGKPRQLPMGDYLFEASILSQHRDPEAYPEIAHLVNIYEGLRIYSDWIFGRKTIFREPQPSDSPSDRLAEDFSNLGLILSRLRNTPKAKRAILDGVKDLYEGVTDFQIHIRGGYVEVFFHEGDFAIPAKRLSDGTLRYLFLLMLLCDPDPPPLICIEEPELGLHPDIIPKLADLLIQASQRTQIIVTTHSDVLVDAMTERPEAVVVCEKVEGQTHMRRLTKDELAPWLDKYRLGELWSRGGIGANRW